MKLWHIDKRLGRDLGINGKWADVPSFQIVNDISASIRSLGARVINLEYGPKGSRVTAHRDWEKAEALSMTFQQRFSSFNADALKSVRLYEEMQAFIEAYLVPIEASVKDDAL